MFLSVYYFLNAQFENLENYYKKFYYNPFIGYLPNEILIYPQSDSNKFKSINFINNNNDISISKNKTDLYIIGCGDYFRTYVYPHFKKSFNLAAAIDFNYEILRNKFLNKFKIKTNDFYEAISGDSDNNKLAIIASYHSYHTTQALEFMKLKNSKVIIEKPPCVNYDDFNHLLEKYDTSKIFIGYNRRHIPWVLKVKKLLKEYDSPCVMSIEIKEVQITKYHWYNAPNQGSRIAGNLCHWIDLTIFLLEGKKPVSISISKNKILGIDNSTFIILFDDGSIVTLIPSDYGDGTYGVQEFIKIRNEKLDIRIDDFMHMRLWINGKVRNYYKLRRDKGHDIMYKKFCNSILSNKKSEYTKNDLIYSTSIYLNFIKLYYSDESNMELHFS